MYMYLHPPKKRNLLQTIILQNKQYIYIFMICAYGKTYRRVEITRTSSQQLRATGLFHQLRVPTQRAIGKVEMNRREPTHSSHFVKVFHNFDRNTVLSQHVQSWTNATFNICLLPGSFDVGKNQGLQRLYTSDAFPKMIFV